MLVVGRVFVGATAVSVVVVIISALRGIGRSTNSCALAVGLEVGQVGVVTVIRADCSANRASSSSSTASAQLSIPVYELDGSRVDALGGLVVFGAVVMGVGVAAWDESPSCVVACSTID